MVQVLNFWESAVHYVTAQDLKYRLVVAGILVVLFLSLILLLAVFVRTANRLKKEAREARQRGELEGDLMMLLLDDNVSEKKAFAGASRFFWEGIHPGKHKVLTELLIFYHRQFTGLAATKCEWLYKMADLRENALRRLRSGHWYIKGRVITELAEMRVATAIFEIKTYTDHSNVYLRNEAQYAVIRLGGLRGMDFLDDLHSPMSEFQQMRLMHEIKHGDIGLEQRDADWLKSENPTVVLFALRIARQRNQFGNAPLVAKLLDHPDRRIVASAVKTLTALHAADQLDKIKNLCHRTVGHVQAYAVEAVGHLGGEGEYVFLRPFFFHEEYETVRAAFRAAMLIGRKEDIKGMGDRLPEMNGRILEHVCHEGV